MRETKSSPPWDAPEWLEPVDNAWRRGLRWQQAWWRATQLNLPAGHIPGRDRPVATMLPDHVTLEPNLISANARHAAETAITALATRRRHGIINQDRLRRNLLSSQPLCFNLFGHLSAHPDTLLPWVRTHAPHARAITRIRLEWAPSEGALGGSAFDAFIEYQLPERHLGFLGVECKYAENLTESQRAPAAPKYKNATAHGAWRPDAAAALDRHGLRQFWYNTLLAHTVAAGATYAEGKSVVVACAADEAARHAVNQVRDHLRNSDDLTFSALEDVIVTVQGHDGWKAEFNRRYLDFTPIQHLLDPTDPRKTR